MDVSLKPRSVKINLVIHHLNHGLSSKYRKKKTIKHGVYHFNLRFKPKIFQVFRYFYENFQKLENINQNMFFRRVMVCEKKKSHKEVLTVICVLGVPKNCQ